MSLYTMYFKKYIRKGGKNEIVRALEDLLIQSDGAKYNDFEPFWTFFFIQNDEMNHISPCVPTRSFLNNNGLALGPYNNESELSLQISIVCRKKAILKHVSLFDYSSRFCV